MGSLAKGFLRKVCGNSAENLRKFAKIDLVDVSDIFIFSARGRGRRSPVRQGGGGFIENPRGGGSPRRGGWRGGAGRVSAGNLGGG